MNYAWERWCTSDHGAREYEFWRDAVCDGVVESELTVDPEARSGFSGTMFSQTRDDSRLVNFKSARHRIRRSSSQARQHGADRLMLSLQCSGRAMLQQNGGTVAIGPGDFGLLNAGRPFDIDFPDDTARRLILLPHALFGARSPMLKRLDKPASIKREAHLAPLLTEAVRLLTDTGEALHERTTATLLTTVVELLSVHFASTTEGMSAVDTPGELSFAHLKRYIDMHVADPDLSPTAVALACRVSLRTLHRLFARHAQTSFENHLIEARLVLAYEALQGARARTVGEAAYACGFNNLAHFSKRFSARFGVSPVQVLKSNVKTGAAQPHG